MAYVSKEKKQKIAAALWDTRPALAVMPLRAIPRLGTVALCRGPQHERWVAQWNHIEVQVRK